MISYQNCKTRSLISTLLHIFWNSKIQQGNTRYFHSVQIFYWSSILSRFIKSCKSCLSFSCNLIDFFEQALKFDWSSCFSKGGEIRDTKTLDFLRNIGSLQVLVDVSRFSPCMINLSRNKNICCRLKKWSALIGWFANLFRDKLWVWWKTSNKATLYFSQQISLTCNKCFCCATSWSYIVKNGKHRPKLATKQCCARSREFLYYFTA